MPTYEYACRKCGEHLEVVQAFSDKALTVCPNCGGELKKVFGNIGIVFKGSGFYKTDSRSTSKAAKTAANGSSAESATDTTSKSSKESKKSEKSEKSSASSAKSEGSSAAAAS
jgi:putative FmdB family regulatory protein